jgi:hypothetical protein
LAAAHRSNGKHTPEVQISTGRAPIRAARDGDLPSMAHGRRRSLETGVQWQPPLPQLGDGVGGAPVVLQLRLSFPRQWRSSETVKAVMIWHRKAFGSVAMVESRARVGGQNLMKSMIKMATIYRGLNLIS